MLSADEELILIKDFLTANPKGKTISEIAKALSISRISAARYLDRLVYSGQAEMRKFGRANVYTLVSCTPISHILNLFPCPAAIVGPDLFIRDTNSRFLDAFRLQRGDLVGHELPYTSLPAIFPDPFLPLVRSALNGIQGSLEHAITIHGRTVVFNMNLTPVTDETGRICAAIILEDISLKKHYDHDLEKMISQRTTELSKRIELLEMEIDNHKEARVALKASHQKYRSLAEDMPAYICCFETDGTITYANENFFLYIKKEESEVLGKSLFLLASRDGLAIPSEKLRTLNSDHPSITIVKSMKRPDGQLIWQQWTCRALFNKTGRVCEYQTIGIDITSLFRAEHALAENEKTLDAIIRGSPLPQFVIDRNHTVVFWNTAMEQFTKIPAGRLIGTKISGRFFYHNDHPLLADLIIDEKFDDILKEYPINCRKSGYLKETWQGVGFFQIQKNPGTWIYFTAAIIRDMNGDITHVVETMLDLMEYCTKDGNLFLLNPEATLMDPGTVSRGQGDSGSRE